MPPSDPPRSRLPRWPLLRQFTTRDRGALGEAARSARTDGASARTATADAVVPSICPYCAVGCGQRVYVKDGEIVQVEGDPDSPISRGRLCPKGSATRQLVTGEGREYAVRYRRPHATQWEHLPLERAMEMIADRVIAARAATWQDADGEGEGRRTYNRCMGIANLGGATLDNEENYLIKKLCTALGIVQVENQARI